MLTNKFGAYFGGIEDAFVFARIAKLPLAQSDQFESQDASRAAPMVLANPVLAAGIRVSSESLAHELRDRSSRPLSEAAAAAVKRYALRAGHRPVPFGLFAGISPVAISDTTDLAIRDWYAYVSTPSRYAGTPADCDMKSKLDGQSRIWLNPTIKQVGGSFVGFYFPGQPFRATRRIVVRATSGMRFLADACRAPTLLDECCSAIADRSGFSLDKARELVQSYIRAGVLFCATGPSTMQAGPFSTSRDNFTCFNVSFRGLEQDCLGGSLNDVLQVPSVEIDPSSNVDLTCILDGTLGKEIDLAVAVYAEAVIRSGKVADLSAAYRAFLAEYDGTHDAVPLVDLMASSQTFVDTLLSAHSIESRRSRITDQHLLFVASESLANKSLVLELSPAELDKCLPLWPSEELLPAHLEIGFSLLSSSACDSSAHEWLVCPASIPGTNGFAKSVWRFSPYLSDELVQRAQKAVAETAVDQAIDVEFVYLPDADEHRAVTSRAPLYNFELRVPAGPEPQPSNVIGLDDLLVVAGKLV